MIGIAAVVFYYEYKHHSKTSGGFTCDTSVGTCVSDPKSTISLSDCDAKCSHAPTGYTCNTATGTCDADPKSTTSQADCEKTCTVSTTNYTCDPKNGTCVADPNSTTDLATCKLSCKSAGYTCNTTTYECDVDPASTTTVEDCQAKCLNPALKSCGTNALISDVVKYDCATPGGIKVPSSSHLIPGDAICTATPLHDPNRPICRGCMSWTCNGQTGKFVGTPGEHCCDSASTAVSPSASVVCDIDCTTYTDPGLCNALAGSSGCVWNGSSCTNGGGCVNN